MGLTYDGWQGGLLVAFLLLLFGTHSLAVHNPTNMNFSFSHLLSATRNTVFDDLLGQASRHHAPAKVLQNLEGLVYTEVKGTAREAFQSVQDDFGAWEDWMRPDGVNFWDL